MTATERGALVLAFVVVPLCMVPVIRNHRASAAAIQQAQTHATRIELARSLRDMIRGGVRRGRRATTGTPAEEFSGRGEGFLYGELRDLDLSAEDLREAGFTGPEFAELRRWRVIE